MAKSLEMSEKEV